MRPAIPMLLALAVGCAARAPRVVAPPTPLDVAAQRDQALRLFLEDAARALEHAAAGKPHEARWDGAPADDLRSLGPGARKQYATLGPARRRVATFARIELTALTGDPTVKVDALAFGFLDGKIRWALVGSTVPIRSDEPSHSGLALGAPALQGALERVEAGLAARCVLPMLTLQDLAELPPDFAGAAATNGLAAERTCALLPGQMPVWSHFIRAIGVLLRDGDHWALVVARPQITEKGVALQLPVVELH